MAWPSRAEIINSTIVVIIGVVVLTSIIFFFDWITGNAVNWIFD